MRTPIGRTWTRNQIHEVSPEPLKQWNQNTNSYALPTTLPGPIGERRIGLIKFFHQSSKLASLKPRMIAFESESTSTCCLLWEDGQQTNGIGAHRR